ncbi:hypothetical protein EsH8_I_000528 [Colletotrichum jinshuiense]
MYASQPTFFVLGDSRLALICLAAKLFVWDNTTTGSGADKWLESYQLTTFHTFLSHFVKPKKAVWRQIPLSERRRLLEVKYPASIKIDEADDDTISSLFSHWYRDLERYMPEVMFLQQHMQPAATMNTNNTSKNKAPATKMSETAKKLPNKRTRDEDEQKEAKTLKKTKLAGPSDKKPSTTTTTTAKAPTAEKPQQRWLSEEEVARIGRRPQGKTWKSKISPIYC